MNDRPNITRSAFAGYGFVSYRAWRFSWALSAGGASAACRPAKVPRGPSADTSGRSTPTAALVPLSRVEAGDRQMMIVMKASATEDQVQAVIERIESCGAKAHPSRGEEVTVIGAVGDREHVARLGLEGAPGVEQVVPILKPYKLASSQMREPTVLEIGGRRPGGEHFSLIAGPCTVESRDQVMTTARAVRDAGGSLFRGGAYKPRSSPYSFQGLGQEGL